MTSLHNRIFASYSILIAIILIILGMVVANLLIDFYYQNLEQQLEETAWLLAQENIFQEDWKGPAADIGLRLSVIDDQGQVLFDNEGLEEGMDDHSSRPEIVEGYAGRVGIKNRFSSTLQQEMLYVAVPVYDKEDNIIGVVRVSRPLTAINEEAKRIRTIIFTAIIFVLPLIWFLSFFIIRSLTRSLSQLTNRARAIGSGEFPRAQNVSSSDEIGQLEMVFNEMSNNLKHLVKNLEREKEKTVNIIRKLPVGVLVIDRKGEILAGNPLFYRLLDIVPPDRDSSYLLNITHEPSLIDFVRDLWKEEDTREREITLDNPERHLRLTATPLDADDSMIIVVQDMTKLKKLEEMRKEFVANVSHELRTPLTAIKGFTETLCSGAWKEEEALNFLDIIEKETHRLSRLIDDLLILSRLEAGNDLTSGTASLDSCTGRAQEILGKNIAEKELEIIKKIPSDLQAGINEDDMTQVILNLLSNAVTYSPRKGKVIIEAGIQEGRVYFSVQDEGPGIPYKDQQKVFHRFYRVDKARSRESGGTGLGLAIVKHIAERAGGQVELESAPGHGSNFTVWLPSIS